GYARSEKAKPIVRSVCLPPPRQGCAHPPTASEGRNHREVEWLLPGVLSDSPACVMSTYVRQQFVHRRWLPCWSAPRSLRDRRIPACRELVLATKKAFLRPLPQSAGRKMNAYLPTLLPKSNLSLFASASIPKGNTV